MSRLVFALALSGCLVPALAFAQQPGQGPPMPVGMDLKKVTLGSWAEYSVAVGKMPSMKTRMALVARAGRTNTVEMIVEGGMMAAAGGSMVMQTEVDTDGAKESTLKKLLMQMGQNDPMEMPISGAQQRHFQKPNPKALIGEETIKVAAGTFKAKHYRDKTPKGDTFNFWISDKAPPLGLVKMEGDQKSAPPGAEGPVVFELTLLGGGAKPRITKKARPFDQAALMGQIMGGGKGGGGPGPGAPGGVPTRPLPVPQSAPPPSGGAPATPKP